MKVAKSVGLVLAVCVAMFEARAHCQPSAAQESAKLPVGDEETNIVAPRAPSALPSPAPATTLHSAPFAAKERGFALEAGLSFRIVSTIFTSYQQALLGTLFLGAKRGRVVAGLGIQLSETTLQAHYVNSSNSGSIVNVFLVPGVRLTMTRAAKERFEVVGEFDLGLGRSFGDSGAGSDRVYGLPPGTAVVGETFHLFLAVGPVLRYWVHPQFAVESNVLFRADYVLYTDPETRHDFLFNFSLGLRLLVVL